MARTKGAKGQRTVESEEFRERMHAYSLLNGGFDRFFKELESLKGYAYVKNYLSALEFAEPKLQRTELAPLGGQMMILLDLPLTHGLKQLPRPQEPIESEEGSIVPIAD